MHFDPRLGKMLKLRYAMDLIELCTELVGFIDNVDYALFSVALVVIVCILISLVVALSILYVYSLFFYSSLIHVIVTCVYHVD